MRKLTSAAFRKCGSFWVLKVLNQSYWLSKSGEISKKNRRHKKRHAANFGIWCPKRSSTLANRVVLSWWSFRNPILIIVAVSFFCDAAYFRWRTIFFRLFHLWRAITPSRKLPRSINYTFLESSGRQLSHGGTLDIWTCIKISSNLPESKKK